MAGIQEYLDLIKNAVYGRDVRQAIHDGIEQCYYDASGLHYQDLDNKVAVLTKNKVNQPLGENDQPTYGTSGQSLRTKGDGTTEWASVGLPTDEQTEAAIDAWLDEHPEATTTVQDGSLTYKKLVIGTLGFVTPEMFGAKGDGVTDDTVAIQSAIDSGARYVFFSKSNYLHSEILIEDKTDLIIDGNGSTHTMNDEGRMFHLKGYCSDIVFKNFVAIGKADQSITQSFFFNLSSSENNFKNITIKGNRISKFTVGISVNADLGGTLDTIVIEDNYVDSCLGTEAGEGYGIHISDATLDLVHGVIRNNTIANCERHSIYVARGAGYKVYNNKIVNHRRTIKSNTPAVAIGLKRCKFVEAYGNQFIDCYDGHIQVSSDRFADTDIYPHEDYMCEYIDIHDNFHTGDTNIPCVWLGYSNSYGDFFKHISFRNNIITCGTAVELRYGYDILIKDNMFYGTTDNRMLTITAIPSEEEGVISDLYYIIGNRFIQRGNASPLRLESSVLTNNVEVLFENNISPYSPMFIAAARSTNTKIKLINQDSSGIQNDVPFNAVMINGKPTANPFSNPDTYRGDVNDLHDAGYYFVHSSATNIPVASFGFLEVIGFYENTACVQRFTKTDGSGSYYRACVNNSWSAWRQYTVSA